MAEDKITLDELALGLFVWDVDNEDWDHEDKPPSWTGPRSALVRSFYLAKARTLFSCARQEVRS